MRLFRRADNRQERLLASRYEIEGRIGSGGMAIIYKGRDRQTGRTVAIKMIRPDLGGDGADRTRLLREVRAARAARHENIVEILETGETPDGAAFIVLEHLDGRTVSDVIEAGPVPLRRALRIIAQVCRGLAHAHGVGVIHRDIKPTNLMLVGAGEHERLKILDFGLATMTGDVRLTATGQVFGTPEYLSAEQATGARATALSDQYSTGVVLYELLTGSPPFVGEPDEVIAAHFRRTPVSPSKVSIPRPVPEIVDGVVMRMLAKKPDERFADMSVVERLVEDLIPLV